MRVLSMPDGWEYPWFAAWDLAFHAVALALVDPDFAEENLWVLLFEQFQHPNGQLPAYEWEFSDVNPPVHAWACLRVYMMRKERTGQGDRAFLERCFHKLLMNFAWWVNKVDSEGNNVFEGGFLGLDNITVSTAASRSKAARRSSSRTRPDGWGSTRLCMMRIALELARENHTLRDAGDEVLRALRLHRRRDEAHGRPRLHDVGRGRRVLLRRAAVSRRPISEVRSALARRPDSAVRHRRPSTKRPSSISRCSSPASSGSSATGPISIGEASFTSRSASRRARAVDRRHAAARHACCSACGIRRSSCRVGGIRSLSKHHEAHPFTYAGRTVSYEPAEAVEKIKGGNSNWRGPVWFPTSFLLIESLVKFDDALLSQFAVKTPASPDKALTPREMAKRARRSHDRRSSRASAGRPARISAARTKFQTRSALARLSAVPRIFPRRQRRRPRRHRIRPGGPASSPT